MRRILLGLVASTTLAFALGCGSLQSSPPSIALIGTRCGVAQVSIVPGGGFAREIHIAGSDGSSITRKVEFLQGELVVEFPMPEPGTITVMDGGYGRSVDVTSVEAVTLDPGLPSRVVAKATTELHPAALSGPTCDFSGMQVIGMLGAGRGEAPYGEALVLPGAPAGDQTLTLSLVQGPLVVAQLRQTVTVLPPCEDADGDGVKACDGDCDDTDPTVHPGAEDRAGDGIDNDCDGVNGTDRDKDGHEAVSAGGDDCDDSNPAVFGGVRVLDADRDGYFPGRPGDDLDCNGTPDVPDGQGGDCDDHAAAVHPGQPEPLIGNRIDDDCDGITDEGTNLYDDDGDGQTEEQGDCDDGDARRHSDAVETYDCVDNDCDGTVDEGAAVVRVDDRYEPNDTRDVRLSAAKKMLLGYTGTRDLVQIVSRDDKDVEQFSIVAHDGLLDNFGVEVTYLEGGQGVRYEAVIRSPTGERRSKVLTGKGDTLLYAGTADHTDTGTYVIEIKPSDSALEYCPARFAIVSR